jgi:RimJ/RimL family protein N-acetyltransferase
MLRAARPGDEPKIEAFLARHAETSMFLRSNLLGLGLSDNTSPHGTAYWLAGAEEITAVFGISNAGFVLMQAPDAPPELFAAFAARIAGRNVKGFTGVPDQVTAAKRALGLASATFALDNPEPLYRLRLDALRLPSGPGEIRPPAEADRNLIFTWTRAYSAELQMSSPDRLDEEARGRTERALSSGDVRILHIDGQPVGMTAINARLPDMVQIGGVYTPPALRGRGHARRAVALHMAEARAAGVDTAILFASGPAACRAYEAIGFRRIGAYALAILAEPQVIGRPEVGSVATYPSDRQAGRPNARLGDG